MRLKELYSIKDVAKALHCSEVSVRTYYKEGRIKTIRIGRLYKVREEEILWILKNGLHPVTEEYRAVARRKRAVTRSRAKARAAAQAVLTEAKGVGK